VPAANLIVDPVLVALHDYWRGKFRGGRLPGRADIDPADVPHLLPWLFLMDVAGDPLEFRYRLIGTGIVNFLGRDYTGRTVDEGSYGDRAPVMRQIFASALARRDVTAVRGHVFYVPGRAFARVCWTMMPLAADGETIDMLLCGYVREGADPTVGTPAATMSVDSVDIIETPEFARAPAAPWR
jgi:hypothetical protein